MRISDQAKMQIIGLIGEGESLDPFDLEGFYRWLQASYEVLGYDSLQQQRFDEYCRSLWGYTPVRLHVGVSILKQALYKDAPEDYAPTYSEL